MKLFYQCVFVLAVFSGGYYIGQQVGHDHVWDRAYAMMASHSAVLLSAKLPDSMTKSELKEFISESHRHAYRDGIIAHGRFHSNYTSRLPMFIGQSEFGENLHSIAYSRYPDIAELKSQVTPNPTGDKYLDFLNNQTLWFDIGLGLIQESRHNKSSNSDGVNAAGS